MNDNPFNLNDTLCHAQIGLLNFEIPNIFLINPVICEYNRICIFVFSVYVNMLMN